MGDGSACFGTGECGRPGVGEEVQHFGRLAPPFQQLAHQVPVDRLLGKNSGVFKTHGLEPKGQPSIANFPNIGNGAKHLPPSAAFGAAVIPRVGLFPQGMCTSGLPDHLGIGPNEHNLTPTLQPFSAIRIDAFVIFPTVCRSHSPSLS